MSKNKLSDLNDHLFLALERLNEEELTSEKIELEERRVKAISTISRQIVSVSTLVYNAAVDISIGNIDDARLPKNFDTKQIEN